MSKKDEFKNIRAHQRYYVGGKRVPGVTTPLNILAKPALIPWANRLGLDGIEVGKYVDKASDIGTLAHIMASHELGGPAPDFDAYSPEVVGKAENAMISFLEWKKHHDVKPLLLEEQLVSKQYMFGGTIDCYGEIDGELGLLDFKTGKAIYPEHFHQLAAYAHLLDANHYEVASTRIVRIGRDENEGFGETVKSLGSLNPHWEIFKHCLAIYNLKKQI